MKTAMKIFAAGVGLVFAVSAIADPKIEEQEVGPVVDLQNCAGYSPYIVSPRGLHLATVVRKGSRLVVMVDGVAGPKFDEIVAPSVSYIDPRPYQNPNVDINTVPRQLAVTFSKDGQHYAYVGRQSQEWVLMADNKEVLRIPATGSVGMGTVDMRLEYTGPDAKHLLFSRSEYGGYALWVDGQKWPGLYASGGGGSAGTVDPIVSPDGTRIAYTAQVARDKTALIVDGKEAS